MWTASSGAGDTIASGLPNITGSTQYIIYDNETGGIGGSNAFSVGGEKNYFSKTGTSLKFGSTRALSFNASKSSSIYGNSTIVQPPAYKVYVWKKIN